MILGERTEGPRMARSEANLSVRLRPCLQYATWAHYNDVSLEEEVP
jgi:hypothetical protein